MVVDALAEEVEKPLFPPLDAFPNAPARLCERQNVGQIPTERAREASEAAGVRDEIPTRHYVLSGCGAAGMRADSATRGAPAARIGR